MGAIDVGVGHDDDAVIAQLLDVEFFLADARTQSGNQSADLGRAEHFVKTGLLNVENLAL